MAKSLRPAKFGDRANVESAIAHLRSARNCLKLADCPQSVAKVRRALKSAEGALRHVGHREYGSGIRT